MINRALKSLIIVGVYSIAHSSLAEEVVCPSERITGIQLSDTSLYWYNEDRVRRRVSSNDNIVAVSIVTNAIANGAFVRAAFPEGHDCNETSSEVMASWIYRSEQSASPAQPHHKGYPGPATQWLVDMPRPQVLTKKPTYQF